MSRWLGVAIGLVMLTSCGRAVDGAEPTAVASSASGLSTSPTSVPSASPSPTDDSHIGMHYEGSQTQASNALIWWGSDRYLEPPPADSQPVITQQGALAVYNQVSDYASDNVPRAVKLVLAHTAPAQAPFGLGDRC